MQKIFLFLFGLFIGVVGGYIIIFYTPLPFLSSFQQTDSAISHVVPFLPQKQVIGFLPYWLTDKSKIDYSKYVSTLAYFGVIVGSDGHIVTQNTPQEDEPGWYALTSGKLQPYFANAKKNNVTLSLVANSGDQGAINQLMNDPVAHADNFMTDVMPLMKKYGFSDLNLDIESTSTASPSAQNNFTLFTKEVKQKLENNKLGTLTIEVSPTDLIRKDLIDLKQIAPFADHVVIMAYDYHYTGSYVTGPVSPLSGAGTSLEYDTQSAVQIALATLPARKIILGIPLYGYEWETINNTPQSGIIPGSGIIDSNNSAENFLQSCATCSAQFDQITGETHVIYKDQGTGTYHQMFFPDEKATQAKVSFANQTNLGGIALWALGYEGKTILTPLTSYK